jgi:predicted nucleotidyltransferase
MFFSEPFGGVIPGARGAVLAALLRTGEQLTGRQVHSLVSDDHSLWSVQEALRTLTQLGLVETRTVGRAGVHTINEANAAIAPLRALADPIASLKAAVGEVIDSEVKAVILFGSIARGEAALDSDIDLAVIASKRWDKRVELHDTVRQRLGNACDVIVFTQAEFSRAATAGEPVVADILRDGVALVGTSHGLSEEQRDGTHRYDEQR